MPVGKPEIWSRKGEEVHYGGVGPHWAAAPMKKKKKTKKKKRNNILYYMNFQLTCRNKTAQYFL